MEHVEVEKRELVYKGSILDVYADTVRLPNGHKEAWDFVSHRKGAAAVVPVLPDGRIVLVHQYRHALKRMTWEIPAGSRDSVTEDTMVCARRELTEETGYTCDRIEPLISLKTTVAFCDEFIDVYAYSVDELCEMIYSGKIEDGKTIAAIMSYKAKYEK